MIVNTSWSTAIILNPFKRATITFILMKCLNTSKKWCPITGKESPLGGSAAGFLFPPCSNSDITETNSFTGRNMLNHQLWLESQIFHARLYGKNVKDPVCFHSPGLEWSSPTAVPHCRLLAVDRAKRNHKRNSLRTWRKPSNCTKTGGCSRFQSWIEFVFACVPSHLKTISLFIDFYPSFKGSKIGTGKDTKSNPTCLCWYI